MPRSKGIAKSNRKHVSKTAAALESSQPRPSRKRQYADISDVSDGVVVSEMERRIAIKTLWVAAGKPKAAEWQGHGGLVPQIVERLSPFVLSEKHGSKVVLAVLKRCAELDRKNQDYDGRRKPGSGGHNKKMVVEDCLTDDAMAIGINALNQGFSMPIAVARTNARLAKDKRDEIDKSVLIRIVGELGGEGGVVGTSQQGSRDKESKWATASLAWAKQLDKQLEAGKTQRRTTRKKKRSKRGKAADREAGKEVEETFFPICMDHVFQFDQHHAKCEAGAGAGQKFQWRVPIRIPAAVKAVIAAEGAVVDLAKRTGHRAAACRMLALHPDALEALEASEAKFGGC